MLRVMPGNCIFRLKVSLSAGILCHSSFDPFSTDLVIPSTSLEKRSSPAVARMRGSRSSWRLCVARVLLHSIHTFSLAGKALWANVCPPRGLFLAGPDSAPFQPRTPRNRNLLNHIAIAKDFFESVAILRTVSPSLAYSTTGGFYSLREKCHKSCRFLKIGNIMETANLGWQSFYPMKYKWNII